MLKHYTLLAVASMLACASSISLAGVSAEQAATLKTTLTPMGGRDGWQCGRYHTGLDGRHDSSPGRL